MKRLMDCGCYINDEGTWFLCPTCAFGVCSGCNAKDAEIKALKARIVELDHKYARALSDLVAQRREGEV